MNRPDQMTTMVEVLERLRQKKMDNEFKWSEKGFTVNNAKFYQPEDLKIIKTFRFEGESNPDDSSIVSIIEAKDGLIGYTIDAYGMYTSHENEEGYDNFMRRIPVEDREAQLIFEL